MMCRRRASTRPISCGRGGSADGGVVFPCSHCSRSVFLVPPHAHHQGGYQYAPVRDTGQEHIPYSKGNRRERGRGERERDYMMILGWYGWYATLCVICSPAEPPNVI